MKNFNELPETIQNEIKDTLKAYDKVDVTLKTANIILDWLSKNTMRQIMKLSAHTARKTFTQRKKEF